ncbi:hypothetical protein PgNI_05511 [Pyricularia grisea]|uniref:Uncharacterized protein n=1 Tax=Pyricularia grisea TaxID=148305 RepID=A0A6P8B3T2_PYRGI|nr:hypothetical protein PgNI_05511 [Pyricularia grisea]TLD09962.1 hypothetical protein PgNI_05511 [Pyricularia grisea]
MFVPSMYKTSVNFFLRGGDQQWQRGGFGAYFDKYNVQSVKTVNIWSLRDLVEGLPRTWSIMMAMDKICIGRLAQYYLIASRGLWLAQSRNVKPIDPVERYKRLVTFYAELSVGCAE